MVAGREGELHMGARMWAHAGAAAAAGHETLGMHEGAGLGS